MADGLVQIGPAVPKHGPVLNLDHVLKTKGQIPNQTGQRPDFNRNKADQSQSQTVPLC